MLYLFILAAVQLTLFSMVEDRALGNKLLVSTDVYSP